MTSEYEDALKHMSKIQEFVDMNEFLEDDQYGVSLDLAMQIIANPNVSVATARKALVQMQAWSMYFKNKGNVYLTIHAGKAGSPENHKKNVYISMAKECHELAQSLKYLAKDASLL